MSWSLFGSNFVAVLSMMTVLWAFSIWKRDVSIVDPWWSMAFLLIAARTVLLTGLTPGKTLLLSIVALWSVRLWWHLLRRSRGKPEDPRYTAFRQRFGPERYWWISFFQVFVLQGILATLISIPLQFAGAVASPDPVAWNDLVGVLLFVVGFAFEAISDAQLQAFRDDPASRGQMDRGLWHYSRHPNYFGETVLWWGFWLCTLDVPNGWMTFPAPALMTFLLLRVSGVTLLDSHLKKTKPKYADYIARTPAFVPGRPKA
jgi:steroid 5-alpha reductase family enzyme